ncbi:MAG: carboxypeptidase regulatory-like domain-containing protein [Verrucomicrobiota bacterium]
MKSSFFKRGLRVAVFQLGLLLCQNLPAVQPFFNVTPTAVSNTYSGTITLQISNLIAGDTVVVQNFLDANANGVIDAGDILMEQFQLKDGVASVFHDGATAVTNFNVPGDTDGATNGQITAQLGFSQLGGVVIIGKYALKLSSPSGNFTPITNFFSITNFPYAGSFTGNVISNGTSTTLPNAVVLLAQPSNGGDNVQGGVVANDSGGYTIEAPPGNYTLFAFKSNFVANLGTAPSLALSSGTIPTNLSLIPATRSISGKIVDANNSSLGLPGISGGVSSTDNFLTIYFTDTNGNFNVPVTASEWKLEGSVSAFAFLGYLGLQNKVQVDTTAGSTNGITIAVPKATAVFYGSVKDNLGNPLAGVDIDSDDNNGGSGQYEQDISTDANTNYNYVAGALGGDTWEVEVDGDQSPSLANYIFSQSQNGSISLTNGQAVRQDFTAILATNQISGHVQDNDGDPISGVGVNANTTTPINGVSYSSHTDTDNNGNYTLNVANGDWSVSLNCGTGGDSLGNSGNYQCPCDDNVTISNNNVTTNFTVLPGGTGQIFGYVTNSAGTPIVGVSVSATDCNGDYDGTYTDGNGYYSFNNVANYIYDVSVNCGDLSNQGYQCVSDQNVTVASDNVEQDFTPQFSSSGPLQITTTYLPNGTNTEFYSQTLQASGGTLPYGWAVADYSALPLNLTLATNGVLSGTLSDTADTNYFDVVVTDAAANASTNTLSLTIDNPPLPPLVITNTSLPNGNVGASYSAQLGATGGQSPYSWSYALGSQNLSLVGMSLNLSSGLISGKPTTNRVFTFKVQVTDSSSVTMTNSKVLSITINPKPVLGLASWLTNQFQMRLTGGSNQNYTIQVSTNLSSTNWTTLFVTNNAVTNSFIIVDPSATNKQRFYRAVVGP